MYLKSVTLIRLILSFFVILNLAACDQDLQAKSTTQTVNINNNLIAIKADKVEPETGFTIEFRPSKQVTIESAHIEGATMYMGKIPLFFEKQGHQVFSATGMVGACTTDNMVWRIVINYQQAGTHLSEQLEFTVE